MVQFCPMFVFSWRKKNVFLSIIWGVSAASIFCSSLFQLWSMLSVIYVFNRDVYTIKIRCLCFNIILSQLLIRFYPLFVCPAEMCTDYDPFCPLLKDRCDSIPEVRAACPKTCLSCQREYYNPFQLGDKLLFAVNILLLYIYIFCQRYCNKTSLFTKVLYVFVCLSVCLLFVCLFLTFIAAKSSFSSIWRLSQLPVTGLQI
jgi:hypothetical protein